MTESTPPKPNIKFNIVRILSVLIKPRQSFAEIAIEAGSSWLMPMLTLSLTGLLGVIVSGYETSRAAMLGNVALPPDWQYWTPAMQSQYMQAQQSMQGPVFVYVIPFVSAMVGLWLGWMILSGLLHLGSTLFGGRGSMSGAMSMVGWAYLPFAVRDILRMIYMLFAGHSIVSAGLSGFASGSVFLAQILSRVDIFFIWSAILLVIGFAASDGLPKGKAIMEVVIVLLILLLAQAGIGTLISSIGGLATSNPIF
jgi:hypothetical protein